MKANLIQVELTHPSTKHVKIRLTSEKGEELSIKLDKKEAAEIAKSIVHAIAYMK